MNYKKMGIEDNINYEFKNKNLLKEALCHTSYAHERGVKDNEKLEFLGDSILEFVSSKYLYLNYPRLHEGELTKARAAVVCEDSLYEVAKKIDMPSYIKVSAGEMATNGNHNKAILADSIEALIAAIYFDGGLEVAEKFIINNLKDAIGIATKNVGLKDYKTVLQEKLQVNGEVLIEYRVISENGPAHDKTFEVEVLLNGKVLAKGVGKNKKHAEMNAAKNALDNLK